jgi:hypothetical protein
MLPSIEKNWNQVLDMIGRGESAKMIFSHLVAYETWQWILRNQNTVGTDKAIFSQAFDPFFRYYVWPVFCRQDSFTLEEFDLQHSGCIVIGKHYLYDAMYSYVTHCYIGPNTHHWRELPFVRVFCREQEDRIKSLPHDIRSALIEFSSPLCSTLPEQLMNL